MVMVELPDPGAGIVCGLKLTVAPAGMPEADRLMGLLKPPLTVVVIAEVPWFPCATLSDAGDAETEKLPGRDHRYHDGGSSAESRRHCRSR